MATGWRLTFQAPALVPGMDVVYLPVPLRLHRKNGAELFFLAQGKQSVAPVSLLAGSDGGLLE